MEEQAVELRFERAMQDLQSRIEALLAAPAGQAFLLIAAESRLAPETIANPGVSLQFTIA